MYTHVNTFLIAHHAYRQAHSRACRFVMECGACTYYTCYIIKTPSACVFLIQCGGRTYSICEIVNACMYICIHIYTHIHTYKYIFYMHIFDVYRYERWGAGVEYHFQEI